MNGVASSFSPGGGERLERLLNPERKGSKPKDCKLKGQWGQRADDDSILKRQEEYQQPSKEEEGGRGREGYGKKEEEEDRQVKKDAKKKMPLSNVLSSLL